MYNKKIKSLKKMYDEQGLLSTLKNIKNYKKNKQIDIFKYFDYVSFQPFGEKYNLKKTDDARTINWVVPDFNIGGGGHLNIFRLIYLLEKIGYQCRVVIIQTKYTSAEDAGNDIRTHFYPIKAKVSIGQESLEPAAITVATSWITAYVVRNFQSTLHKCYFVQDYEPYFYPQGSQYAFAEATYKLGFHGITAGDWLSKKLTNEHGMKTLGMGFSYDRGLYQPHPKKNEFLGKDLTTSKKVFFYARPATARRGFELGLLVLNLVAKKMPDVTFVLAGGDLSAYNIPFKHFSPGNVAVKNLPELYSQCDVALVLSLTDLSLLPLELMASGCPVVSNRGENVEWLLNDKNAILTDTTVEALSEGILSLLQDEGKRLALIEAGLTFSANTQWETEAEKVATFFDSLLESKS